MEAKTETAKKSVKVPYKDLTTYDFSQLMSRIARHPTTGPRARVILKVVKAVQKARDKAAEEHKAELSDVFGKKGEDGKTQYDDHGQFLLLEGKEAEAEAAAKIWSERVAEVEIEQTLSPLVLGDFKLNARELELMGELYTDETGPGLPPAGVTPLR